jgi:hypothetical protein
VQMTKRAPIPKSESHVKAPRQARLTISHVAMASASGTVTAASPKSVMIVQFNGVPIHFLMT